MRTKVDKESLTNLENGVSVKTVGLIVNPIAGMGGAVGLKGTDGKVILEKARILGAKPIAPARAQSFLSELRPIQKTIRLVVGAGRMGEDEALSCSFTYTVVGKRKRKRETAAEDTKEVARRIVEADADLLVFCGGDGTARDILEVVNNDIPVLGVPTGVKMHSAVFAVEPKAAARIATSFLGGQLPLREAEVMDVDEEAFRKGRVSAGLYGYLLVPYEPHLIQEAKMASPITESEMRNQAAIAIHVIESMMPDVIYIIGPGTTTRTIGDLLDTKKTLLGVDLFCNKKLIAKDVNERQILEEIKGKTAQIIVTPIGGQGFIFGRGNQQISSEVIRRVGLDKIVVIATEGKLRSLRSLRVDTGDPSLDSTLRGRLFKVITDYRIEHIMHVE
ncbi:MAG: ATP-NAD kinase family protein [Candidatus Bathycorpusculaceae bacterium]